jgi:hypothetical protein
MALVCTLLTKTSSVASDRAPAFPHLRTTDRQLAMLVREATRCSATFARLLDRLNDSDVVAYLEYDLCPPAGTAAYLRFVAAAGGRRYVRIGLSPLLGRRRQIEYLGYELQHAVEIADAASVVNQRSMRILYSSIGFESAGHAMDRYESDAAVETGHLVERELYGRPALRRTD